MDTIFELLFFALLLLFPLLQRGLQKRKQQQAGTPVPPLPHETEDAERPEFARADEESVELDQALQEIRDLLGMSEPAPRPKPQAAPKPQQPVTIVRRTEPAPLPKRVDTEFRAPTPATFREEQFESLKTEPFEAHDEHDKSEEAFEALAPYDEPFRKPKREAEPEKSDAAYGKRPESARQRTRKRLLKKLRQSQGARDAILLSEILGPPKGMK